jgi:hypothetical protein
MIDPTNSNITRTNNNINRSDGDKNNNINNNSKKNAVEFREPDRLADEWMEQRPSTSEPRQQNRGQHIHPHQFGLYEGPNQWHQPPTSPFLAANGGRRGHREHYLGGWTQPASNMFMNGGPHCDNNFWRASSSHFHHHQPHFHPRTSYYNLRTSASEKPPSAERTGLPGIQPASTVVPTTSQQEAVRGQQMVNNEHHAAVGPGDPLLLAELKKCLVMFRIPKPPSAGSSGRKKSKTIHWHSSHRSGSGMCKNPGTDPDLTFQIIWIRIRPSN